MTRFPGNPWGEIAGWMDGFPGRRSPAYEAATSASPAAGNAGARRRVRRRRGLEDPQVGRRLRRPQGERQRRRRQDGKAILARHTPVWSPPRVEGIRDTRRRLRRGDRALATAKQRLLAFLAGFVYNGFPRPPATQYWTDFLRWLIKIRLRTMAGFGRSPPWCRSRPRRRRAVALQYRAASNGMPARSRAEVARPQSIKLRLRALATGA